VDNTLDNIPLDVLENEVYKRRQAIKQQEREDRAEVERAMRALLSTNETVRKEVGKNSKNSYLDSFLDEVSGYRVHINIYYQEDEDEN